MERLPRPLNPRWQMSRKRACVREKLIVSIVSTEYQRKRNLKEQKMFNYKNANFLPKVLLRAVEKRGKIGESIVCL